MKGDDAVKEAINYLKKGRPVKIWDDTEEVLCHPSGMYIVRWGGSEICKGLKGCEDYIKDRFENKPKVFIVRF